MRFSYLGLCFLMFVSVAQARRWEPLPEHTLNTGLFIATPSLEMDLRQENGSVADLEYRPNSHSFTGVGLAYGMWGLSLAAQNPNSPDDEKKEGQTTAQDYKASFHGYYTSHEIFYQQYKGYYLANSNEFAADRLPGEENILRGDIEMAHYGYNFAFNIRPDDFSLAAMVNQTEIQTQSGGTFLLLGSIDYYEFSSQDGFVPASASAGYGDFSSIRTAELYNFAGGAAAAYTFERQGLFLSGLLGLSMAYQRQELSAVDFKVEATDWATKTMTKLSFGYNVPNWSLAMIVEMDSVAYDIEGTDLTLGVLSGTLLWNYRWSDVGGSASKPLERNAVPRPNKK